MSGRGVSPEGGGVIPEGDNDDDADVTHKTIPTSSRSASKLS